MARKKKESLYDQVKSILNELQGPNTPNYQGLRSFWLDPDIFLNESLYGYKLIADLGKSVFSPKSDCCGGREKKVEPDSQKAQDKSCCGDTQSMNLQMKHSSALQVPVIPKVSDGKDCWPNGEEENEEGDDGESNGNERSNNSAIIIGLKGEYPFDGSMFPRLMWDSDAIATPDQIQFIADWIDKGCPLTIEEENQFEQSTASFVKINEALSLAKGDLAHSISSDKTNTHQIQNKGLTVRKEVSSLTIEELTTFREAIACMMQYNDYSFDERSFNFWARIHTNSCQHGWEQFGPWHRLYLYFFEQMLQDYDDNISLPYWSWTDYSYLNTNTFNNSEFDLGVLPDAYGCYLTKDGMDQLKNAKSIDGSNLFSKKELTALESIYKAGTVYNSGLRFLKAAGIEYGIINQNNTAVWDEKTNYLYTLLKTINPLWFPNRWPGSIGGPTAYPTKEDIDLLLSLDQWSDFGGGPSYDHHFGSLEKVHNGMHNFSGGTNPCYPDNSPKWAEIYKKLGLVADPQSEQNPPYGWMVDNRITAYDPLFWGHHSNVDRIWALWQEKHSGKPEENGALAPWSLTVEDTYSIKKLGYCYMKDSVFYNVNSQQGIQKFRSAESNVSQRTLDTHRKAEIKLHRVRRGNLQNAYIRVFLNSPDADASTPTTGNDHFVEQLSTFHGSCYGGPGHCKLPLDKTRGFDKRNLHHHEPRNFKIDATEAIQRVLNKGAKDITIQIVVVGINGKPMDNALFIDGVSLNFMD